MVIKTHKVIQIQEGIRQENSIFPKFVFLTEGNLKISTLGNHGINTKGVNAYIQKMQTRDAKYN